MLVALSTLASVLVADDVKTQQTVQPPISVGMVELSFIENNLVRPDPNLRPGEGGLIKTTIRQTITPSRVAPGEPVQIVWEYRFSFPAVNYTPSGPVCRTTTEDFFGVPYIITEYFAESEAKFHLYPVGDGNKQYVRGPGITLLGDLGGRESEIDDLVENCEQIDSHTVRGSFIPQAPGAYYVSLGSPHLTSLEANGSEIALSSVNYRVDGLLPIVQVDQYPADALRSRTEQDCKTKNAGDAKVFWREPEVWRQLQHDICVEATRFGISPILLAALLQHEGAGRTRLVQSRLDKWIEENLDPLGQNESIGPGQMRPDLAVELSRQFDGTTLTEDQARDKLAHDSVFAVHMAAAELARLQGFHGLDDRQAFIAYAGGVTLVPEFKKSNFNGPDAKPRGEKYDHLYGQIAGSEGFPEPAMGPTW